MTHRNILIIALKLGAIFLFINVMETLPNQWAESVALDNEAFSVAVFSLVGLPALFKVIIALTLWIFPNRIILSTVPDSCVNKESPEYFVNLNQAFISVVGIYLVAFSFSDLSYFVVLKSELARQFGGELQPQDQASFVATCVELGMGTLLILGNKGIAKIVHKLRN